MTQPPEPPIGPQNLPIGDDGIAFDRRDGRRVEDKLQSELDKSRRRAQVGKWVAISILIGAIILSIILNVINTGAINKGNDATSALARRALRDEEAQKANRGVNVSIWCTAINTLEVASIRQNHISIKFHPLPCSQLANDAQSGHPDTAAAATSKKYIDQYGRQLATTTGTKTTPKGGK